jgi:hypothetical protein
MVGASPPPVLNISLLMALFFLGVCFDVRPLLGKNAPLYFFVYPFLSAILSAELKTTKSMVMTSKRQI